MGTGTAKLDAQHLMEFHLSGSPVLLSRFIFWVFFFWGGVSGSNLLCIRFFPVASSPNATVPFGFEELHLQQSFKNERQNMQQERLVLWFLLLLFRSYSHCFCLLLLSCWVTRKDVFIQSRTWTYQEGKANHILNYLFI